MDKGSADSLDLIMSDPAFPVWIGLSIYAVPYFIMYGFGFIYTAYQLISCYMAVLLKVGEPIPGLEFLSI